MSANSSYSLDYYYKSTIRTMVKQREKHGHIAHLAKRPSPKRCQADERWLRIQIRLFHLFIVKV